METNDIITYKNKLMGSEGVEPVLTVADLVDNEPEAYQALRPYIRGEMEWPDGEAEPVAADAPVVTDNDPVVVVDEPAVVVEDEPDAPEVEQARATLEDAAALRSDYEAKKAAQTAILDEAEPDEDMDPDAHRAWRGRQRAANRALLAAQDEYLLKRDDHTGTRTKALVEKSATDKVVKSIGTDFPELALPKPYAAMEADYNAWAARAVSVEGGPTDLQEAYKKFQTDADFAKKVGPLPKGHKTLFIYMHAKAAGGDFEGNVLKLARQEGVFKGIRGKAAEGGRVENAEKSAAALEARANEQRPVRATGGSQEEPIAVNPSNLTTEEQDMQWLAQYQKRTSGPVDSRTASEKEADASRRAIVIKKWAKNSPVRPIRAFS